MNSPRLSRWSGQFFRVAREPLEQHEAADHDGGEHLASCIVPGSTDPDTTPPMIENVQGTRPADGPGRRFHPSSQGQGGDICSTADIIF